MPCFCKWLGFACPDVRCAGQGDLRLVAAPLLCGAGVHACGRRLRRPCPGVDLPHFVFAPCRHDARTGPLPSPAGPLAGYVLPLVLKMPFAAPNRILLLVEDNPSDIALPRRALQKGRVANELVVAEDGQEALDYLNGAGAWAGRDTSDIPALVLLDLKLPKIHGLEVLRQIRAGRCTRRLPVVILTTSKEEQDLAASYDLGVNSYVRKPVDFKEFARAIEELGVYWLLLNEPPPKVD
jgi:two-component system, response regulator